MKDKAKPLENFEKSIILIIVFTTILTACCMFITMTALGNRQIVQSLRERSEGLYGHVRDRIDPAVFSELNAAADMEKPIYQETRQELDALRRLADFKYLYTVRKTRDGQYAYVVDGQALDSPDMVLPGQSLEEELRADMERALNGEIVLADKIRDTGYGPVYVSYWPAYDADGNVVGAIGMEYDAENMSRMSYDSFLLSFLICSALIAVLSVLSIIIFKGVFAPFHNRVAYTDALTGLRNRTAFETDMKRLRGNAQNLANTSIILFDLNNLKLVNDQMGHSKGDEYLKLAANIISKNFAEFGGCYRIGGDEFCALAVTENFERVRFALQVRFLGDMRNAKGVVADDWRDYFSIAYGLATFTKNASEEWENIARKAGKAERAGAGGGPNAFARESSGRTLDELFTLADQRMYKKKKEMKMTRAFDSGDDRRENGTA